MTLITLIKLRKLSNLKLTLSPVEKLIDWLMQLTAPQYCGKPVDLLDNAINNFKKKWNFKAPWEIS